MSRQNERSSGDSLSVVSFALVTILGGLAAFVAFFMLFNFLGRSDPTQTAARSAQANPSPTPALGSVLALTVIAIPTHPITLPQGTEPPPPQWTIPPPPTPHIPGPTAQFTTLLPIEQWCTHEDLQAGFSIKYPPDWYLNTTPLERRVFGSTTQLLSYDGNYPNPKKVGQLPPEYIKVEISVENPQLVGHPPLPGDSLADFVHRLYPGERTSALEEREVMIGGIPAFLQVTPGWGDKPSVGVYVRRGANFIIISYPQETPGSIPDQVLQRMIGSIKFLP